LRFATRAKIVKTKPLVNEYHSDRYAIEGYKKQIKMLEEELKNKNVNDKQSDSSIKEPPKEILEYIMKSNESLSNELVNYKELYKMEKERNEQIEQEIQKLKDAINNNNVMISSLMKNNNFSNNNNSEHTSNNNLKNVYEAGVNDNKSDSKNMAISSDGFYNKRESNSKETKSDKRLNQVDLGGSDGYMLYKRDSSSNFKQRDSAISSNTVNQSNNQNINTYNSMNSTPRRMVNNNKNDTEQQQELYYAENIINRINQNITDNDSRKNITNWSEHSKQVNSGYKNELAQLQNKYRDIIKDSCGRLFPRISQELFEDGSPTLSEEKDDIIRKITQGIIFKEIRFIFQVNSYDHFENNIKSLKQTYEEKIDTLEKNMDFFKSHLENFYRKKIQNTRNTKLDDMEFMNRVESPVMMITSEHNEKLKLLRELYDSKLKELEQVCLNLILDLF
jgi:hypothetical protein